MLGEGSYIPQFLKAVNLLDGLEHRVDYIDTFDDPSKRSEILKSVLEGTHVFLTAKFEDNELCNANRDANVTLANLEDFRKSR